MKAIYLTFCLLSIACVVLSVDQAKDKVNGTCQWGSCDQVCIRKKDAHQCTCQDAWQLQDDHHTCDLARNDAMLIFSTGTAIQAFILQSMTNYTITEKQKSVTLITCSDTYVYWINPMMNSIFRSEFYGNKDVATQFITPQTPLDHFGDVAVDTVTGNIYYTDDRGRIFACNDHICRDIVDYGSNPRSLALDPLEGKMYWSTNAPNPHIAKAAMDGTHVKIIIHLKFPATDMVVDIYGSHIYWLDSDGKILECADLNGYNRRSILEEDRFLTDSFVVFGNRLYYSDYEHHSIHSINKFTGKDSTKLIQWNEVIMDITICSSEGNVKIDNPCAAEPCSQLCLLTENQSYSCACSRAYELQSDGRTCLPLEPKKSQFLVVALGRSIHALFEPDVGSYHRNISKYQISGFTYDSLTDTMIFASKASRVIFRYDIHRNKTKNIKGFRHGSIIDSIAYDYIGNNLYISVDESIAIYSFDTGQTMFHKFDDTPLDMVLIPEEAKMAVVFLNNGTMRIDILPMTVVGERKTIVDQLTSLNKNHLVRLAYDPNLKKIIWTNNSPSSITITDIEGENSTTILDNDKTLIEWPYNVAVKNSAIYWTTNNSCVIWKIAPSMSEIMPEGRVFWRGETECAERPFIQYISGHVGRYYLNRARESHSCSRNNGNCSHICLVLDSQNRTCACDLDFDMHPDGMSCVLTRLHTVLWISSGIASVFLSIACYMAYTCWNEARNNIGRPITIRFNQATNRVTARF